MVPFGVGRRDQRIKDEVSLEVGNVPRQIGLWVTRVGRRALFCVAEAA